MKALLMKLLRWLRGRRKETSGDLICILDEYPPMKVDPVAFARDVLGVELTEPQKAILMENPVRPS